MTVLAAGSATIAVAHALHLPVDLAVGLFTGAVTNTPALAAATDVIERIMPGQSANIAAGYGIAYPYSMLGVVLLVQLLPRLLRRDLRAGEQSWRQEQQWFYRVNTLSTLGALCACMTNPPGLAAANAHSTSGLPTLAYASVYPVALIAKIVLAQRLVELLRVC